MSFSALLQYAAFLVAVTLLVKPVGRYMARVFSSERTALDPLLCPLERLIYRLTGVQPDVEMCWQQYALSFVAFGMVGTLLLYLILRLQQFLPFYFSAYMTTPIKPDLAMNTAISFATTTTWQAYGGETTMSYFSQVCRPHVAELSWPEAQASPSASRSSGAWHASAQRLLGNFWVDVTRATLWVLLPLAVVGALVLVWQGVPMNFAPYAHVAVVQPVGYDEPVTDPDGKPVLDEKGQPKTRKAIAHRAGHRDGPGRRARAHQEPRHERRRLLQRQRGAPLRESDTARESSRAAVPSRCCPPRSPTPSGA